jgi:hypothetical protein
MQVEWLDAESQKLQHNQRVSRLFLERVGKTLHNDFHTCHGTGDGALAREFTYCVSVLYSGVQYW